MEASSIINSVLSLMLVLGLIGLTAVALRYFGGERFIRKSIGKINKKRLKLVDFLVLDGKRKLILVRRDNIEHLILIGGEKETIVESNIKAPAKKK